MRSMINYFFSLEILGIPLVALSLSIFIIVVSLLLRKLIAQLFIKYLSKLVERTETDIDDMLLKTIRSPLKLAVLGAGFYLARLFIIAEIPDQINNIFDKGFQLFFVVVICLFLYRSADLIIVYLQKLARKTSTKLDDLLLPYLKKVLRVIVVIIIIIKFAEIFLGTSMAALLGFLGGMGLTLGLVFKDIIANWFGCAIIYLDQLFQEGDWITLDDGKIIDADVEEIGLRSTKFRNFDKTVSIVPNDTIARSIIKNWSRMFKRRIKFNIKIDSIAPEKLEKILTEIRNILAADEDVHQEFHMVNFREIEGNSRVIRLYYFTKTIKWKEHEQVRENINLKLLKLFETEGVERLAYTIVDLSDDRPKDFSVNIEN